MSALGDTINDTRLAQLLRLKRETFDLLVIGGGAVGCGVARDAALRGARVALIERRDFAYGSSSRSTRLIHGGLRYLQQAQLGLVFESTNERAVLRSLAPHLVTPLAFLFPTFSGKRPRLLTLEAGLWVYEALCGFSVHRLHRMHLPRRTLELEPQLRAEGLTGSIVYYDARTDDARLTLETVMDAQALGAVALSHVEARRLLMDDAGRVIGARAADVDALSAAGELDIKARVVVTAAGVWTDQLRATLGERPVLRPTKGVHIVVDAARLKLRHAVVMQSVHEGRVMFAIPWGPRTILGTTDTDYDAPLDELWATRDDVAYILETTNHHFPSARLGLDDVTATWAGLRPLYAPATGDLSPSEVSREHVVLTRPGLVALAGGKLTTYRLIAKQGVDAALRQLGRAEPSLTHDRPLPGAELVGRPEALDELVASLEAPLELRAHLVSMYGVRARRVARRLKEDPTSAARLAADLPHTLAEVDEAVTHEGARRLSDVLERRIPLYLRALDQGLSAAPAVARRMGQLLGWSEATERDELAHYTQRVERSRAFRV